ncbi:hypothetical protein ACIQ9P_03595 [Kitasatospora sp. NPDC094019]|uniref:hypothetical protein n=1 Tax=Kitasatospora sp. NPDC094019 TaxID=3364091 RepID=UPI00381C321D
MNDNSFGQLLDDALKQRNITATTDCHASAGSSWFVIALPDKTALWTSDYDSNLDIAAADITGLTAIHHLGSPYDPNPAQQITLFDRKLDRRSNRTAAVATLAETIATYVTNWPSSPTARHPAHRVGDHGVMNLPARHLRPGDVITHTATGHESVVTHTARRGRGDYQRTVRTLTPATRGSMLALPETWWQFPKTLRCSGSTLVTVVAHRHIAPNTLPPAPYPPVPEQFTDGDHVVHDGVIWERTNGHWFNQDRTRLTPPTRDDQIRRLFTEDASLRNGIPTHQPNTAPTTNQPNQD